MQTHITTIIIIIIIISIIVTTIIITIIWVARGKGLGFLGGVGTLGWALGAPGPFRLYWGKGVGVHWGGLGL